MHLHIPFNTLADRHLVYAYVTVWVLQFGYAIRLFIQWRQSSRPGQPD